MTAEPRPWRRIVAGYLAGLALAYFGLAVVGWITPDFGRSIAPWARPIATDVRWSLPILLFVLLWIGGPHFVERMRAAWHTKPQPQRPAPGPKKVSPETLAALRGTAAVLQSRPVGEEPAKPIAVQGEVKVSKPMSAEIQRTLATAAEIDREVAKREAARRVFNAFSPNRPMTDLPELEWIKLRTLFDVVTKASVGNQKTSYLKLKFLPDTENRDEDALLLLIYGYGRIYFREASIGKLEESLTSSGCCVDVNLRRMLSRDRLFGEKPDSFVDELVRSPALAGKISQKLGLAQGGYYKLTDKGAKDATNLFEDLVRRA